MPHDPEHHDLDDEQPPEREPQPWTPTHGPITKLVAWLILVGIALTVLAMLAVLIFDRG